MKRRKFIEGLGLATPSVLLHASLADSLSARYRYPTLRKLADVRDDLGRVAVYLRLNGLTNWVKETLAGLAVEGGQQVADRRFFFASGEKPFLEPGTAAIPTEVVAVLWLTDYTGATTVTGGAAFSFTLDQLVTQVEWQWQGDDGRSLTAYLLGHREIGAVAPGEFLPGGPPASDTYSFAILADPQGGDPRHERYTGTSARMQVHNAFTEESIKRINELEDRPLFTLVLGDYTDHQGEEEHFETMHRIFAELKTPILLEIGNHETRYGASFGPGYNMEAFTNYFTAQRRLNGLDKLLYSFDLGAFHYIVWPDPLRSGFWETHPHYFDWLERDLENNKDRPTILFQHVPVHPIGIDPLVHYAEQPYIKQLLLELLTRHGNVRYVFSGHVHIPIKSSAKTAVTYRGINFINLPAAGYRPRAFGEEDYFGGPSQGAAIVNVAGDRVSVTYVDATRNVFTYPQEFDELPLQEESLLTRNKWELAHGGDLVNGDFRNLAHWHGHFVYQEDELPTYTKEIRELDGLQALYLRANKRRYDKPGQDRVPQTLNQLTQVVRAPGGQWPQLELRLQVDCAHYFDRALLGAFIWIEGYWGHHQQYSLIYSAGKVPKKLGNRFHRSEETVTVHRDVPLTPGQWYTLVLNPGQDLASPTRPIDRWAVNLGVWNINDGNNEGVGAYFASVRQQPAGNTPSQVNGQALKEKSEDKQYVFRVDHTAGEHVIADQEDLYFFGS